MATKPAKPVGSLPDNLNFLLFGNAPQDALPVFKGYVSALDPTAAGVGVLIGGSQNTLKLLDGNVGNRPGLKRRGTADATIASVTSSTEWYTSLGAVIPLRVTQENKLQFESDIADGETLVWYDLMTGLDSTRFVFDTWWDNTLKKDTLLFVKFDNNTYSWQGGIAKLESSNTSDASGIIATMTLAATGASYAVNDTLTIAGGGGSGATATVDSVSATGAVTSFTLVTRGTGYSNTSGAATTTSGGGTGATITITVATGAIELDRDPTAAGFAPSGSVLINGNTYTYGSVSGNFLLGISPDPTSEADDSVVFSTVVTHSNKPTGATDNFTNDFIKVVTNQLHVGSYNSRLIYVSDQSDYTDFTVPAVRAPGDPDLLTLDSSARGITVQKGSSDGSGHAVVSGGLGDWYTFLRENVTVGSTLTEQVTVVRSQSADLATALAHEFIEIVGDTLLFLDQNNQLREFGNVRNIVNPVYPLLSLDIFTELQNRDFTGGHMRAVADQGDTTLYITAPNEGIDYMYQVRQKLTPNGDINSERIWQPPQVRSTSRIAVIEGVVYGYSNVNPQMYQFWNTDQYYDDSPSDEPLPYESHAIFSYLSLKERSSQLFFSRLYYEGYCTPGTILYSNVYLDYQGAKGIRLITINKPNDPGAVNAKFFGGLNPPSLGQVSLGQIPLGDGILPPESTSDNNLPKFRAIRSTTAKDVYEFALDVFSIDLDAHWELQVLGANMQRAPRQPTGIMS